MILSHERARGQARPPVLRGRSIAQRAAERVRTARCAAMAKVIGDVLEIIEREVVAKRMEAKDS